MLRTLTGVFSLRHNAITLIAFAALGFAATEASAKTINLSHRYGQGELKAACEKAGGSFGVGSGGYGCEKECAPGKYCTVQCANGAKTCTGTTPDRTQPGRGLTGILQPPHAGNAQGNGRQPKGKAGLGTVKGGTVTTGGSKSSSPTATHDERRTQSAGKSH